MSRDDRRQYEHIVVKIVALRLKVDIWRIFVQVKHGT